MIQIIRLLLSQLAICLKPRAELHLENLVLRHQLDVLRRSASKRLRLTNADRLVLTWLLGLWPQVVRSIRIVHPKTLVRWHRRGFKIYCRWKSRSRGGRPKVSTELRALIRQMSTQNPLWGAPRIHGELLKLGFELSQSTVSKYLPQPPTGAGQTWKTFLRNHMHCTASVDYLVVPTLTFKMLFVLVVLSHERRRVVHFGVTTTPTAAWTAQQITEAFPWEDAPKFLIWQQTRGVMGEEHETKRETI